MSTIHTVEIDLDFSEHIDKCIETLRDRDYFVFADEEQVRYYFGECDLVEKIKEICKEARNKVLYEDVSQDYKELYDKLDRVLFYE